MEMEVEMGMEVETGMEVHLETPRITGIRNVKEEVLLYPLHGLLLEPLEMFMDFRLLALGSYQIWLQLGTI
jgi:hypothetical protein